MKGLEVRQSKKLLGTSSKRFLFYSCILLIFGSIYLIRDYFGPKYIHLHNDTVIGVSCLRAKELIVQEFDERGDLWASRGMILYRLKKGERKFQRMAHVPTGFSIFWVRNFTLVRRITVRPECIEAVIFSNGDICATSAGKMWFSPSGESDFRPTHLSPHYGFGNQGIRNDGIISVGDSSIYFGEYFNNTERNEVSVFESNNRGQEWDVAHVFPPEQIRHIHALQQDPYTQTLWICTGDSDSESMLAWSDDAYNSIVPIGTGSQQWRICQLVYTEDAVYWGTDTGDEEVSGIYKWDKQTEISKKLHKVNGAIFYGTRLAKGTVIMSTNREGMNNERDDKTRLFAFNNDTIINVIEFGTWNHKEPGFRQKYAKLRFQRDQGASSLAITVLNQKEFPDGELIIISENSLKEAAISGAE